MHERIDLPFKPIKYSENYRYYFHNIPFKNSDFS